MFVFKLIFVHVTRIEFVIRNSRMPYTYGRRTFSFLRSTDINFRTVIGKDDENEFSVSCRLAGCNQTTLSIVARLEYLRLLEGRPYFIMVIQLQRGLLVPDNKCRRLRHAKRGRCGSFFFPIFIAGINIDCIHRAVFIWHSVFRGIHFPTI